MVRVDGLHGSFALEEVQGSELSNPFGALGCTGSKEALQSVKETLANPPVNFMFLPISVMVSFVESLGSQTSRYYLTDCVGFRFEQPETLNP